MSPLLETFANASKRGWYSGGLPKPATVSVFVVGGGGSGTTTAGSQYKGGKGATAAQSTTYNLSTFPTGSIIIGGAASDSSGFGLTGLGVVGQYGSQTTFNNTQVFTNGSYNTKITATFGSNYFRQTTGQQSAWLYYTPVLNGQNGYTIGARSLAYEGRPSSTNLTNNFYFNTTLQSSRVTSPIDYQSSTPYVANTGSGGSSNGGTGYSGTAIMYYPMTFAKLTATTGTVVYTEFSGNRYYKWNSSGSYTV